MKANSNQSGGNWTHRVIMRGSINAAHRQHEEAFGKLLSLKCTNKGRLLDVPGGEISIAVTNLEWVPTMR